jgi:hypothetical protein
MLRRHREDLNSAEQGIVAELTELTREGRTRIVGPIRHELLSGIKNIAQFEKLRELLRAFPDEAIMTADYEAAASAGNLCRPKGIAVSPVDVLMCAISISRGLGIFTTDPDFKLYGRALPIRIHAVRPQR